MDKIPIFVITCDRLEITRQSIRSYQQIKTPYEIVIHDNGSSFKDTVSYLKRLKDRGIKVYRRPKITTVNELNLVRESVKDYFLSHEPSNFVVTDCDIALHNVSGDILEFYTYVLHNTKAQVVGPMLEIDDIPDYYPRKERVLQLHKKRFWNKPTKFLDYKNKRIKFINAPIDTTFGMYRKRTTFKRHQQGIRTHAPYTARHLDWYLHPNKITPDQEHYIKNRASAISHWSNPRVE